MAAQEMWETLSYNPPWDPMSLIQGENLAKSYGVQDVFRGVDVALPHQARVALVGLNGVGKSTLLRLLAGLETPDEGQVQRSRNLRIGYLPQESIDSMLGFSNDAETLWELAIDAFASLRRQEAQLAQLEAAMAEPDQVDRALQKYGTLQEQFEREGGYTYQAQARQVLRGLGFSGEYFHRPLNQFSGGERTRAHLARLLLDDPELLILDEPTNHLDIEAVEWLETWMRDWPGAALIVSHDRYFVDRVVDTIWDLTPSGVENYRGNYSAYVKEREARRELVAARIKAQQKHIRKEQDFIQRNIAGQKTRQAQGRRKRLERLINDEALTLNPTGRAARIEFNSPERSGDIVLETQDLVVGYSDGEPLFHVPDLVINRGQRIALIGPNGVGKTTLLKTLLGEQATKRGLVNRGASVEVGYFAQAHADLDPESTLEDEVRRAAPDLRNQDLRNLLARYLFGPDDLNKTIGMLSGGERARVALIHLILDGANFLLLDEPTNHLDLLSQEALQEALDSFPGTLLLVSHDRYLVQALANEVWYADGERPELQVYPYGYQEYLEARSAARDAQTSVNERVKTSRQQPKKGMKERLPDLEKVEAQIKFLESELEQINQAILACGDDYQQQKELGERYRKLENDLEMLLQLWERAAQAGGLA
jgi:ATP-binding cassette subfamily F protein 3